ncbi:hypothetical protein SH1V18_17780 [Vallitalea longa]|uniref:Uroporphyrinogen decarboxylase (URO-D) domain-containing protein n=1 Tax=Vallitalea longa TaxID=2936439 RepID=A0A9W6DFC0_9FIRM|nr:hypothetical protein [Vallitalea longa]GKX29298.1 hypothetical protein SH1V18_17780 [Vallitalea longa]
MLHDPSHHTMPPVAKEIILNKKDIEILRRLGAKIAEIASLPIHKEKADLWTKLNDLNSSKPMVWINEIPWHEMNVNDELTLLCEHEWARDLEDTLRKTIYKWNHMPGDMIVNPYIECPLVIHSTDFGIKEETDVVKTDEDSEIYSRHFKIQIKEPADIEKIKLPKITHNEKATEYAYQAMCNIFEGIIPVKKVGQTHIWFTPWDYLIRWWGVQEAMMDLVMRPNMVHDAVDKMVDAWMIELDQFIEQNLLSLDCNNTRIGSGGYGYISDLPGKNYDPDYIKPHNMWGCSNAQIFSEVSPSMHWEFAIEHDMRWLKRWGHTYYGCCEPLDRKMDILRKIPNLRKISVSPWCNIERIINNVQRDYVMSRKVNPAIFVDNNWSEKQAEKEIREFMDMTERKCHVELIMKDISTVNYHPERLWKWEKIAMKLAEEYCN